MILSDVPIDFGFDDVADLVEWVEYFLMSIPLSSITVLHDLDIVSLLIA